ncbi:DUF2188 domain-containing protein [Erythrobacter rubeus]|uniref:DUF2188 domain-containing protein n=1 Tax=Erythrobacter rubeus TaxID=2760803 RepID=A0ABR8KUQ2_9SPHN|nr:DUF2188 domain-containing protein [Erythrobacter rubeus]MBD2842938.1 DUF2188 domain-containing protein [Erythrobacter rubeus]
MSNGKDYWTAPHKDGWQVKREGASRATSVHKTQAEAWAETKSRARDAQSEAYLQNQEGRIRERNTYGNDPRKTKG